MYTDILINATGFENRIALVENGNLVEIHLERPAEKGLVGNIYLGRVMRVLPGMQAAFVDIGLERTGFLYVDDVHLSLAKMNEWSDRFDSGCHRRSPSLVPQLTDDLVQRREGAIEDLLREGQEILVQIAKEPIGSKGARLTCHVTLPCRNLVFMPLTDHIGISRRISDERVREELRRKIEKLRPPGTGFIIRTVAEHVGEEELEADMEFLLLLWDEILSRAKHAPVPSLVYRDLDMIPRAVRDLFTDDVRQLVIDSEAEYRRLLSFIKTFAPHLEDRLVLYQDKTPLFDSYGIEVDINRALNKKVWLRSGGYIVIESTEALTVIDVNTGRYVGKNELAETIFKTNMEAAKEIAYQLRLRNIGGIIIVDFIDMDNEEHREKLYSAFREAMAQDRSQVNILKLSEFGLVQMTRKRSCESLAQSMCEPCYYCNGEAQLKSRRTICYEIFRAIGRSAARIDASQVLILVHPRVADLLLKEENRAVEALEAETGKKITVQPDPGLHLERFELVWKE